MNAGMQKLLNVKLILDTHAFIWLMNGSKELSSDVKTLISNVAKQNLIGISAISLWEISMLHARKRIFLNQPCLEWIERSLEAPGIVVCPLSPKIAAESTALPDEFHGDPADKIIVATARIIGAPLVTKDEKILEYSKDGYLACIPI